MATIYRCDCCHQESQEKSQFRAIAIPYMDYYNRDFTNETDRYNRDLCVECWKRVKEATEPQPKVAVRGA